MLQDGNPYLEQLAKFIKSELRDRFARGRRPTIAAYLGRFPELLSSRKLVLELIYEEYCLRDEYGNAPDAESFCKRYPEWKDALACRLEYHRLFTRMIARAEPSGFPEAGDQFEEFELISLLGGGAASRVFLARDRSLGGKLVALKISFDYDQEPWVQSRLDHPHIVPVNSVVLGEGRVRGMSMPYRPGRTLDEVIRRVEPGARPRRAGVLWQALVEGTGDRELVRGTVRRWPQGDGWAGFPVGGTYAQGGAWIALVVAGAGLRPPPGDHPPGYQAWQHTADAVPRAATARFPPGRGALFRELARCLPVRRVAALHGARAHRGMFEGRSLG